MDDYTVWALKVWELRPGRSKIAPLDAAIDGDTLNPELRSLIFAKMGLKQCMRMKSLSQVVAKGLRINFSPSLVAF